MSVKLEIEIDEPLLQQAEAWAQRHGITLASAVSTYLRELTRNERSDPKSAWLNGLTGIGRGTPLAPVGEGSDTEYVEYLEEKYS